MDSAEREDGLVAEDATTNAVAFGRDIRQFIYSSRRTHSTSTQKRTESSNAGSTLSPFPTRRPSNTSRASPIAKPKPPSSNNASPGQHGALSNSKPSSSTKRYDHLPLVPDILAPNLIILFVGFNPGIATATAGHIYAHPSNRFWYLMHVSGLTPERRLSPQEDVTLPEKYQYGATNIVARPSKNTNELGAQEWLDGAEILEDKVANWRPEAVCIVGKEIWESIWKHKHGQRMAKSDFHYGWQEERENMGRKKQQKLAWGSGSKAAQRTDTWGGAKVFVATSTSGLATYPSLPEKEAIWKELGNWAHKRRQERAAETSTTTPTEDTVVAQVSEEEAVAE